MCNPQPTLRVDGHAVRYAPVFRKSQELCTCSQRSFVSELESVDDTEAAVGVVHAFVMGAECRPVRDEIAAVMPCNRETAIQAVEGTAGYATAIGVHGACPDTSEGVHFGVVHPITGQMRFGIDNRFSNHGVECQLIETALKPGDESRLLAPFDYPT